MKGLKHLEEKDKERTDIFVRGIDKTLWKEFRSYVVREGKKTAQALEEALKLWIGEQKKKEILH